MQKNHHRNYKNFTFGTLGCKHVSIAMLRVGAPEGEFQASVDCSQELNDDVQIIGKIFINYILEP